MKTVTKKLENLNIRTEKIFSRLTVENRMQINFVFFQVTEFLERVPGFLFADVRHLR